MQRTKRNLEILTRKAEGRRQKAEGNCDSCPLPVTVGNKGLSPPPKSLIWWTAIGVGQKPRPYCYLLPSALCLLPSSLPPLESIGYRFGYSWAKLGDAEWVKLQPPLLGQPTADIQTKISNLEMAGGILPLSLWAFYEIVDSVNTDILTLFSIIFRWAMPTT